MDSGLNEIGFEENLRFISYGFDPVVGKHFAKARFYDGGLGRMLAEDPVKRGLNGYSYCDSDPVNYTDPTGEIPSIVIGGGIGALVGGVFGFGGSALSQIWGGEDFIFRKAFGAAANGAIVGGVRGALIGSGVGAGAALAADFGAGTLGSAAEQLIVNGRVSAKESLKDGLINAVTGRIYGNDKIRSLGEALGRGAAAGGVTSGINYLSDAFTPRPGRIGRSGLNGLAGMMLMGAGSAFGRDPRRGCGTGSPDVDWIGERMAYGYQYGASQTAQKKSGLSFNLADFGKEIFVGAVTGGLASAAFYGAGKAVEALAGSIRSNKSSLGFNSRRAMGGEDWNSCFREKYGYENVNWETAFDSPNDIIEMPSSVTRMNPEGLYNYLNESGLGISPLERGGNAGISFHEGGGFNVHFRTQYGNSYIQ